MRYHAPIRYFNAKCRATTCGNQESAIREYQTAARQLSAEDFDLEPIAIYKKILSLDTLSLSKESLASLQEAEELLLRARKAYEEIFEIEPRDDEAKKASEAYCPDSQERREDLEKMEIPHIDDSEPVPIEMLLASSQDQGVPEVGPEENPEDHFPDQETSVSGASLSLGLGEFDWDVGNQKPLKSPDTPFFSPDKAPDERGIQEPVHEDEIAPDTDHSYSRKDLQIDINDIQMDEVLETMLSHHMVALSTDDSLPGDTPRHLADEDLRGIHPAFERPDPGQEPSSVDPTEAILAPSDREDSDHHYNLGIAYYEMDLIDKAIKEFIKAFQQETKPLESLVMLARCYFRKGLSQNAAGFLYQALKLDNLTKDQIEMLYGQIEKIGSENNLADAPPSRPAS